MAGTAIGFVIDKLYCFLTDEASLLGDIHKELADIRDELQSMQSFLRDADMKVEQEDADSGIMTWVKQVRELAYQVEDVIDEYRYHVARSQNQQTLLHNIVQLVRKIIPRHQIASKIQDLKNSVREVRERSERYSFTSSDQVGSQSGGKGNTWHDPRVASLFIDEAELVGIETPKNEVVSRLVDGGTKNMVISVVGMGGLGKTTLAKKVYDHQREVAQFDCCAWVTVSQSYKIEQLMRTMLKEFQSSRKEPPLEAIETIEELQLIGKLREYLLEKRYAVVFDDVWNTELWGYIKHALVDNNKGNRIIITTRNEDVAPSFKDSPFYHIYKLQPLPQDKALELFHKKVFQSQEGCCPSELLKLSHAIVERCEGLPLAIVIIGGLLATKDKTLLEWKKVYNGLKSDKHVESIKRILSLSYHDLPYHLKRCFLFCGMFPEDCVINRGRIIRLWTAAGFVREKQGMTKEEVAEEYLEEIIRRSLVQVARFRADGKVKECRIHDLIHDTIFSRSEEMSFNQVFIGSRTSFKRIGRHLAIHDRTNNASKSTSSNSSTRSILLFCKEELPKSLTNSFFEDFKLLTVMDFEGSRLNYIPEEIGNLWHLSYLSLRNNTKVKKLPRSLGKLHNLETLDLRGSLVFELPSEINKLLKLRFLMNFSRVVAENFNLDSIRGMKIHSSIGCLTALQVLYDIEVEHDIGLVKDLEKLTQLRKLGIRKLKGENGLLLCAALEKMSNLDSLTVSSTNEDEYIDLWSKSHPPPLLQRLHLLGPLKELPLWISKVENVNKLDLWWTRLGDDAMEVLQGLPHLLQLGINKGYNGEQLHFQTGCFQQLKVLELKHLIRLKTVTIEEGALPSLEEFHFGPVLQLKEVPLGIHSLRNLKSLHFFDIQQEFTLSMLPDGGQNYWKIKHVPAVFFHYNSKGSENLSYKLGDLGLLKHLKNVALLSTEPS